jgi:hypothetical protein
MRMGQSLKERWSRDWATSVHSQHRKEVDHARRNYAVATSFHRPGTWLYINHDKYHKMHASLAGLKSWKRRKHSILIKRCDAELSQNGVTSHASKERLSLEDHCHPLLCTSTTPNQQRVDAVRSSPRCLRKHGEEEEGGEGRGRVQVRRETGVCKHILSHELCEKSGPTSIKKRIPSFRRRHSPGANV